MKIYIASTWTNEKECKELAVALREDGHEVDCFCDPSTGRFVFNWPAYVQESEDLKKLAAFDLMKNEKAQKVFQEDKKYLEWCDAVLLILPAGCHPHFEAAYKKAKGGKFFVYGPFPDGHFDTMFALADGLFKWGELDLLHVALLECSEQLEIDRAKANE